MVNDSVKFETYKKHCSLVSSPISRLHPISMTALHILNWQCPIRLTTAQIAKMSSMFYDAVVTGPGDVTATGVAMETAGVLTPMAVGVTAARGAEKGSETGGRGDDVNVAMSGSAAGAGRDMAAPDVIVTGDIVANDGTGTDEFNVDEMLISEAQNVVFSNVASIYQQLKVHLNIISLVLFQKNLEKS